MLLKSHPKLINTYFRCIYDILLIDAYYSNVDGLFQMSWMLPLRIMEFIKKKKILNLYGGGYIFCILQKAYSTKALIYNK